MSKSPSRVSALDGFRGFGCLLVMLGHTQWNEVSILPGAAIAMDLFFVLSGFLIATLLLKEFDKTQSINLKEFWKRRVLRLFPAFYTYYIIGASIYLLSGFKPIIGDDALVTLLSVGLYSSNWATAFGYNLGIFTVTWSLSLEEQFYFLVPLIFLVGLKFTKRTLMMGLFVIGIGVIIYHRHTLFYETLASKGGIMAWKRCFFGLDTKADSLMVGTLFAMIYQRWGKLFKIGPFLGTVVFSTFVAAVFIKGLPALLHIDASSPYTEFLMSGGFTFFAIIGVLITIHLVQCADSPVAKFLNNKFLVHIGMMSYSLYLWHTTCFGGLEIPLKWMNSHPALWFLKTCIRFLVAYGVARLSYQFIEVPILKRLAAKKKFALKERTSHAK